MSAGCPISSVVVAVSAAGCRRITKFTVVPVGPLVSPREPPRRPASSQACRSAAGSRLSGEVPVPVSVMLNSSIPGSLLSGRRCARSCTLPRSVARMELASSSVSVRVKAARSPVYWRESWGATYQVKARFWRSAVAETALCASRMTSCRLKVVGWAEPAAVRMPVVSASARRRTRMRSAGCRGWSNSVFSSLLSAFRRSPSGSVCGCSGRGADRSWMTRAWAGVLSSAWAGVPVRRWTVRDRWRGEGNRASPRALRQAVRNGSSLMKSGLPGTSNHRGRKPSGGRKTARAKRREPGIRRSRASTAMGQHSSMPSGQRASRRTKPSACGSSGVKASSSPPIPTEVSARSRLGAVSWVCII